MASFADIIKQKSKEWDCPELMDRATAPRGNKLPFSSPLMNWCTYGGIPRNKITEFHGAPSGGKSTTAIDICKNAYIIFKEEYETQLQDLREKASKDKKKYQGALEDLEDRGIKKVLYLDLENSFDGAWAETLGIKPDEINIMTPPNLAAEEILETMQDLICTGEVGLVVLDSIPSLVTKRELDKHYGESTVAALAGLLCVFFRKVVPLLTRYECTMLFINQIRDNLDNPYVTKVPGGKAPQFYASLRILFQLGSPVDFLGNELPKSAESPAGYIINAKIVKQKSAPNNRRVGTYFLMYDSGIREDFDFAKLAIGKYGIIKKRGGWFTVCDPYTGEVLTTDTGAELKINGLAKVYAFLQENTEYYEKLKKYISDDINEIENSEETDCAEVKGATEVFGDSYVNANEDE